MNMPVSPVYSAIDTTLAEIDAAVALKFPYRNEEALFAARKRIFQGKGQSPLKGFCGALEGLEIKIQEPFRANVPNYTTYDNRKGVFALNKHAMCIVTRKCQ